MATNIELKDLKGKGKATTTATQTTDDLQPVLENIEAYDSSVATWAYGCAALFTSLATPLLFFPRFVHFLSDGDPHDTHSDRTLSPLERLLSTHFGILLVAIAVTLVLYIPSSSPLEFQRRRDALGHPLLGPLTGATSLSAFLAYNTNGAGSLSSIVFTVCLVVALWGYWVILFNGSSRTSRKTGADKRTSAFLFGNKHAASVQKKEWKAARAQPGSSSEIL